MDVKIFNYPFPGTLFFFAYSSLSSLPFLLISKAAFIFVWFFVTVITTLIINMVPAIRLRSDGIEVQFYFPGLSKWVFLPWNAINEIKKIGSPIKPFWKSEYVADTMIYSSGLPMYYHLPALIINGSWKRSFIVTNRMKNYLELTTAIQDNYVAT